MAEAYAGISGRSWTTYDRMIDGLAEPAVREALKYEARIRAAAEQEIRRLGGDGLRTFDSAPRVTEISEPAGFAATADHLTLDDARPINPGDILEAPRTGERMRVREVWGDWISVKRGSPSYALVDHEQLIIRPGASAAEKD